jgi:hypothetical protein
VRGLPLALRIAGARLAARADWPVAKLAERLTDTRRRLSELGTGDLDVRASFQLSYQELADQQARAFRLLGLWPDLDFHPWLVAALLEADSDTAEALVEVAPVFRRVWSALGFAESRLWILMPRWVRSRTVSG